MDSNLYTKNYVIEELTKKGFYIDEKALLELYKKLEIEAIFEDDLGSEFYDKNVVDIIARELSKENDVQITPIEENPDLQNENTDDLTCLEDEKETKIDENQNMETPDVLETIEIEQTVSENIEFSNKETSEEINKDTEIENEDKKFEDLTLLSKSFEAQEKFREEYAMNEQSEKNINLAQNQQLSNNSERTIALVARSMAKKIAKYVSEICAAEAKNTKRLKEEQKLNRELQEHIRALESQNKKLKLLLAESNKNLNSYKPAMFGLYKKVKPKKK